MTGELDVAGLAEVAMDEVVRLCQPGERWRMSIPANEARDSDLLIASALSQIQPTLDRLAAAEAALSAVREAFDPGELDCVRLGLDCSDVYEPDRWCRACRILAALDQGDGSGS